MKTDITDKVYTGSPDGELVPLNKCACGKEFEYWDFILSIYDDNPKECPNCGRKLFASIQVRVFEITE
jgi:NAD-dependent protein deacetylases, SIR2 family